MSTKLYGIRHHGVGSAKSLKEALAEQTPDIILIESPPETETLIKDIASKDMIPPVAMLVYNPDKLQQAAFYPYTEFSPEWIAIKYGLEKNIPIKFMDMPISCRFYMDNQKKDEKKEISSKEKEELTKDPLNTIAELAGYSSFEPWWENLVEHRKNSEGIFSAIQELMVEIRSDSSYEEDNDTLDREIFMREILREAELQYNNIAVVCGGMHVPALTNLSAHEKLDKKLIKTFNKIKVECTWIPWTYKRISNYSGYGSGVTSPAWYELLYNHEDEAIDRWFIEVARLFRKEGLGASSAHVIEAIRLAETLATIRGLPRPSIQEMYESSVAIFCDGYEEPMKLINENLIIGHKMGSIPENCDIIPLHKDIKRNIQKYQLPINHPDENDSRGQPYILDMREDDNLKVSYFLHRLNVLGIKWATKVDSGKKQHFYEGWVFNWEPELTLKIIEMGVWGNTVHTASKKYVSDFTKNCGDFDKISEMLLLILDAKLDSNIKEVVEKMINLASVTTDVIKLIKALTPLVKITEYGNLARNSLNSIYQIIDQIIPKICNRVPSACRNLNDDSSREMFELIISTNTNILLTKDESYGDLWSECILKVVDDELSNSLIQGTCARLLLNNEIYDMEICQKKLEETLNSNLEPQKSAYWVEGFLHGSAVILLYNVDLWQALDIWVKSLSNDAFQQILPLLRRAFTRFSRSERSKLADIIKFRIEN